MRAAASIYFHKRWINNVYVTMSATDVDAGAMVQWLERPPRSR